MSFQQVLGGGFLWRRRELNVRQRRRWSRRRYVLLLAGDGEEWSYPCGILNLNLYTSEDTFQIIQRSCGR